MRRQWTNGCRAFEEGQCRSEHPAKRSKLLAFVLHTRIWRFHALSHLQAETPTRIYKHFKIRHIENNYTNSTIVQRKLTQASRIIQIPGSDLPIVVVDGGGASSMRLPRSLTAWGKGYSPGGLAEREEEIYSGIRLLLTLPDSTALHLVQHLRDEAHRYARLPSEPEETKHQPELTDLPGMGRSGSALMRRFGSLDALYNATVDKSPQRPMNMPWPGLCLSTCIPRRRPGPGCKGIDDQMEILPSSPDHSAIAMSAGWHGRSLSKRATRVAQGRLSHVGVDILRNLPIMNRLSLPRFAPRPLLAAWASMLRQ